MVEVEAGRDKIVVEIVGGSSTLGVVEIEVKDSRDSNLVVKDELVDSLGVVGRLESLLADVLPKLEPMES